MSSNIARTRTGHDIVCSAPTRLTTDWWNPICSSAVSATRPGVAAHGEFRSSSQAGPDRLLAQKELAAALDRAFATLPFDQRTAIVLREVDGLTYEEIAYSLGVAVGTVKSRLTRARQILRRQLREARPR